MREPADPGARKPASYYANPRAELVAELPRPLGRVLDVGCGSGATGPALREAGAERLAGIELDPLAAEAARALYDEVVTGPVEQVLGELEGPFHTILCYDVLEHLADPGALLRALHAVAGADAHLHISLPNARHFSLVRDLVFRGTFGYTEAGHRDSTHLRWFTRRDVVALLEGEGWRVRSASHPELRRRRRLLHRLTREQIAEFTVVQWVVLAERG
jgi:SAM-dependent methyltransferase